MKVKIKRNVEGARIPTSGSTRAAGVDLYAYIGDKEGRMIRPGETVMIGTGISMAIPEGYFGAIFARSGIATKRGLRPANCVGVIDSDYRGEIIVALHNDSTGHEIIPDGERIAQLVIMPYLPVEFDETDDLDDTERGEGGFGSTGRYADNTYEQLDLFAPIS